MKIRRTVYKITLLLTGLFFVTLLAGQEVTVRYQPSDAHIANPERGWYDQYTTHSGNTTLGTSYIPLNASNIRDNREQDNITLILRLFMLHEFLEEPAVSVAYLEKMQADFDSIRAAGVKCIVRFAYSLSQNADVWDATPETVFSHIESLGGVLANNSDVIAAVQAGFIGAWGEWYYTENFAGAGFIPSETDQQNRAKLVEGLLTVLPENIVVEGRTPAIMKNVAGTDDPILEAEAYDGSFKSRIGHHNDCFLANASDYGTYTNLEADLAYLHETTKYTITGGETCDGSNSYSDCANSTSRLVTLHWTYMNRGYNRTVYDKWVAQGCYDEVNISLGYRISLDSAIISENATPGTQVNFTFHFTNKGYAAPTQFKPMELVLIHTVSKEMTVLSYSGTNDDIRFWLPGKIVSEGSVEVPVDLAEGNYSLAIRFPDSTELLTGNPAYSVQFSNAGMWDAEFGINNLNYILSVGAGGTGSLPAPPSNLNATTVSETQIDLNWTDNSDDETGFEIMRSEGTQMAWEFVGLIGADVDSYSDNSLSKGKYYNYILRSVNDFGFSAWTDSVTTATLGVNVPVALTEKFKIYPNPLGDTDLTIQFSDQSDRQLIIRDIAGKQIYRKIVSKSALTIPGEMFQAGTYIVTVSGINHVSNSILMVN
ncbi:MAG: DUF4832 domain-containing protein [Bacteroidales bacterium]